MIWRLFGFKLYRIENVEYHMARNTILQDECFDLKAKVRELEKQNSQYAENVKSSTATNTRLHADLASARNALEASDERVAEFRQNIRVNVLEPFRNICIKLTNAWEERLENPKMNPKARVANNAQLGEGINMLGTLYDDLDAHIRK